LWVIFARQDPDPGFQRTTINADPIRINNIRKYSFAVRVVEPRNPLPDSIKQAQSKEAFKRALKHRKK
jgi:hypothetical protein